MYRVVVVVVVVVVVLFVFFGGGGVIWPTKAPGHMTSPMRDSQSLFTE